MTKETFTAWAIDTRSDEGHGLIGRYWPFEVGKVDKVLNRMADREDKPWKIPTHMEGCVKALFTTRQLARDQLPSVKTGFPKAVAVKVQVTIKEEVKVK